MLLRTLSFGQQNASGHRNAASNRAVGAQEKESGRPLHPPRRIGSVALRSCRAAAVKGIYHRLRSDTRPDVLNYILTIFDGAIINGQQSIANGIPNIEEAINAYVGFAEAIPKLLGIPRRANIKDNFNFLVSQLSALDVWQEGFNVQNNITEAVPTRLSGVSAIPGVVYLPQGRPTKAQYPPGRITPFGDNLSIHALNVSFNWKEIDDNFKRQAWNENKRVLLDNLLPALIARNMTFSSIEDGVSYGKETSNVRYLTQSWNSVYSKSTEVSGVNVMMTEDLLSLDDPGFSSGWHYVGTTGSAHDPDTMTIIPGLTVADTSSYTAPSHSNSMASTTAIGHYAAKFIAREYS